MKYKPCQHCEKPASYNSYYTQKQIDCLLCWDCRQIKRASDSKAREVQRFESKCIKRPGCWGWRGWKNAYGYAMFDLFGRGADRTKRKFFASRYSFALYKGIVPSWMAVCHKCDNPECVNPDHLFLGTQKDNMDDCRKKGRNAKCSKLQVENVRVAVAILTNGSHVNDVAKRIGVRPNTVKDILHRRTWKDVVTENEGRLMRQNQNNRRGIR